MIAPIRFHLTLGVMALKSDQMTYKQPDDAPYTQSTSLPDKTVYGALELLGSLKPQLQAALRTVDPSLLDSASRLPLQVHLGHLEIMRLAKPPNSNSVVKAENRKRASYKAKYVEESVATGTSSTRLITSTVVREIGALQAPPDVNLTPVTENIVGDKEMWADVLYLAPKEDGIQGVKLRLISDLIHSAFKKKGYLTDTRPLKLHCTILNTSHRKPSRDRRKPFCYSDIFACKSAMDTLFASESSLSEVQNHLFQNPKQTAVEIGQIAHPLSSEDGHSRWMDVTVNEIGLWKMGSHAPDGSYVSCGSISLID